MIRLGIFVLFFLDTILYSSRVYSFCPSSPLTSNKLLTSCVRAIKFYVDGEDINDEDIRLSDISLNRRSALAIGTAVASLSLLHQPANAAKTSKKIPDWTLSNNVKFPTLALNTAGLSKDETFRAIQYARQEGITHIDFHPGIERDGVAEYLSKYKDERKLLFLNTKIRKPPLDISPQDAAALAYDQIKEDLRILNVDNVDMLMLRDSPNSKVIQAQWRVLEELLAEGKTRSIGVINYCPFSLESVLETAKIKPAVNYIMVHVGMGRDVHGLRTLGEKSGIKTFSYGQTGEVSSINNAIANSPVLKKIAAAHEKSVDEVALKWVLQHGMAASIRPSSNNMGRCIGEECEVGLSKQVHTFDWELTANEMKTLNSMNEPNDNPTLFSSIGCPNSFGT